MKKNLKVACLSLASIIAASTASTSMADDVVRGEWMRGTWGLNWKPVNVYNGRSETLSIEPFLEQISHLKTLDYIQIHLGESSIKSPVHIAPHDLLESFWEGDTDANGNPINLIVPRASAGVDPFLDMLLAIKAAGFKTQVYINSSNMLNRDGLTNPDYIPDITERWKELCDTNKQAQAFINSQSYHFDDDYPNRPYMFAYAEFVLKEYSDRYGDLIDSWLFDSGRYIYGNGDNATNGEIEDQKLYGAFAKAVQSGNPDASVSFNNSPERDTEALNPFSEATHYDDYMFGHPYNGGKLMGDHESGLYDRNYAHIEKMIETNGYVHKNNGPHDWTFDDKVIGHLDPPMSTTSWNGGNTPALTNDEFTLWNLEAAQNGGAISWGVALVGKSSLQNEKLVARDWALEQLTEADAHLAEFESPGKPNWARQDTPLSTATVGKTYSHTLVEGTDFWDPEGDDITSLATVASDTVPSWLTITETSAGNWTLQGTPNESAKTTTYNFRLRVKDASGGTNRWVALTVENPNGTTTPTPTPSTTPAPTPTPSTSGNVALNGTATQSSTDYSGDASRAIDGNTNGAWRNASVTHTATEDNAWWNLELDAEYSINEIVIHNRTDDCCSDRLSNFVLLMWDADGNRTLRKVVTAAPDSSLTISLDGRAGQRIRINSKLAATALSLAEVEVYGTSN